MNPTQIRVYADKIVISNDAALSADWTAEKFMSKHKSVRYNPLIANTFFFAGFIEAWGRGIERMCDACRENGNPLPEFDISAGTFSIVIHRRNGTHSIKLPEGSLKSSLKGSLKSSLKILEILVADPHCTYDALAEMLGISRRAVTKQIRNLRKEGRLRRVGPDNGGHWEVIGGK